MRYVKLGIAAFGIIGVILSLNYHLLSFGAQGAIVVGACALPVALVAYGTIIESTMPRWAAIVSAVAFLVVAMKTSGDNKDIQNIMMAGAAGLVLAIILAIRPERRRAA